MDDLLEQDIKEEWESPYAAPSVLIQTPNGEICLCIDYQKLNNITTSNTYSLTRLDDLLQNATHAVYISIIDLKSGY